ncbi:MAG: type II toxin-antitoxin system VapC family toxin [Kiritimatiellia bacterium]
MGLLIDTNILIACERGKVDLEKMVVEHGDDLIFLSVISASELLHGVHRAIDEKIRMRRLAFVERVLYGMAILDIDLSTARIHSKLWSDFASAGQMIGAHDLWLAASALANNCVFVTRNVREFERVPGLRLKIW